MEPAWALNGAGSEWFLPLLLLMYLAGTTQYFVPVLMALMLTHSMTVLLPNPIPGLDYNPLSVPATVRHSGTDAQAAASFFAHDMLPRTLQPHATLAEERAAFREQTWRFLGALPGLRSPGSRATQTLHPGPNPPSDNVSPDAKSSAIT